jgi:predicted transcriptional regulator of viral defense system
MKGLIEIKYPEFDYQALMYALRDYRSPRDKAAKLISSGDIIRVKKGLYIKADYYRQGPLYKELLANMIYGPSYISLEYALSLYQIIPEKVETITSVTTEKIKSFSTPAGVFRYRHIPLSLYYKGVRSIQLADSRSYLMASPEKALVDFVYLEKTAASKKELEILLFENMRMDEYILRELDKTLISYIISNHKKISLKYLFDIVEGLEK